VGRAEWDELAGECDPGFYGSSEWLTKLSGARSSEPTYLVVETRGAKSIRVSCASQNRFGRRFVVTPASSAYAGWAESFPGDLAPERREGRFHEACSEVAEWCEGNAAFVRLILPPEVVDVRPFLWRGWQAEIRYTYRIATDNDSPPSPRTSVRRWVKRAEDAGLRLVRLDRDDATDAAVATVGATLVRQDQPLPVPAGEWHAFLARLTSNPAVRTFAAVDADGRPYGTMVVGYDRCRAYELLAGTAENGMEVGAGAFVAWQVLEAMREESDSGISEFDFAGANVSSIANFKRGFGGRLVPYYAISWADSRASRWLATGLPALYRKLRGRR